MRIGGRERYVEWKKDKRYQRKPGEFHTRRGISISVQGRVEENIGVYAKEKCSIPAGMGKHIPVQTNHEITGDVLIKISFF